MAIITILIIISILIFIIFCLFIGKISFKLLNLKLPKDFLELTKKGFIRLPEQKEELNDKTLIVNYGESGKRNRGLGYTIEVTIQFVSAKSNELIEIFSLAELEQKREFIRLMSKIDPVNSSEYRSINSTK